MRCRRGTGGATNTTVGGGGWCVKSLLSAALILFQTNQNIHIVTMMQQFRLL